MHTVPQDQVRQHSCIANAHCSTLEVVTIIGGFAYVFSTQRWFDCP